MHENQKMNLALLELKQHEINFRNEIVIENVNTMIKSIAL